MDRLALHLYPSPMDNASRLLRMGRSVAGAFDDLDVRLVGMQIDQRAGLQPVQERLQIDRVGTDKPKRDTLASRFDKVGGWYREVYARYRREPLALVSAHTVFSLPLAMVLGRASGAPVVYNPHELETRTPTMVGLKRRLAETIERSLIGRCAFVSVVNDTIADWYAERYGRRPVVCYNYPSKTAERPARDLRGELGLAEDDVLYVHTGNLTGGRNIPAILDAFERAAGPHVLFVGAGDLLPLVEASAARSAHVHRLPPVPPDDVLSVVKGADIALCLIETKATSYLFSSPNKLFEALAAGVPPLCSDLPEARRALGALASDLVLGDPVAELPARIATLDRAGALALRQRLEPLPSWEDGVQPLLDAYRAVLARPGRR